ncbi:hypothetical protein IWQ61_007856, partial [Dispira simplex]
MTSKQKQLGIRAFLVANRTPASTHAESSTSTSPVVTQSLEERAITDTKHPDRPSIKAKFSINHTLNKPTSPQAPKSTKFQTRHTTKKTSRRSNPTVDHEGLADSNNDNDEEDDSVLDIRQELNNLDTSAIISKRHRSRRQAPISRVKQHLQRSKRPIPTEYSDQDEPLLSGMASATPRKRAATLFRNRHIVSESDSDSDLDSYTDTDAHRKSSRDSKGLTNTQSSVHPKGSTEDWID